MELANSKRVLQTATYVVKELTPEDLRSVRDKPSRGLSKLNFLVQLHQRRPAPEAIERLIGANPRDRPHYAALLDLVRGLGPREIRQDSASVRHRLERIQLAAAIPMEVIVAYAKEVLKLAPSDSFYFAAELFSKEAKIAPIGMIHLERIEMFPVGVERGELIASVPMAPGETTTLSHKVWSISTQEYETIVQDYFESYSERGVSEKSDFSQSTENENRHSNAFNFSASASGGFGPVSITTTLGLTNTAEDRDVLRQSVQKTREVTEKASARARKEHKVSFKTNVRTGTEEDSLRSIKNESLLPLRLDYFRLMRKWRTNLFRYGLRLTFDVALPNPGARLWALHRQLKRLDEELREPFEFTMKQTDIDDNNWSTLAASHGVALEPPPRKSTSVSATRHLSTEPDKAKYEDFEFIAPPGFEMTSEVAGKGSFWSGLSPDSSPPFSLPPGSPLAITGPAAHYGYDFTFTATSWGSPDKRVLTILCFQASSFHFQVRAGAARIPELYSAWQLKAWTALRDAALARFQQKHARTQAERDILWTALVNKDTLSLRRLEREELIKSVLFWIFGPDVIDVSPLEVSRVLKAIVKQEGVDLPDDWPGGHPTISVSESERSMPVAFGEIVKFIHHAIEWENLIYFLYPYFWGSDDLGRERMLFEHPDMTHRDFLRAGYVRVVLPVRPGYEEELINFMETGTLTGGKSPYLTIGEEVRAFAHTNYNAIPPANPEKNFRPLLYPEQRKTWETIQEMARRIEAYRSLNGKYPSALADLPDPPLKDAWGNDLSYRYPGYSGPFDLTSFGANGAEGGTELDADISTAATASLVSTWFDYTPTNAVDIASNSDLTTIA